MRRPAQQRAARIQPGSGASPVSAHVPGAVPWEDILKNPLICFGGPDMERLVAGRERFYLDRFWNQFSADPAKFDETAWVHYAQLSPSLVPCTRAAFDRDATDNRA